MKGDGILLHKHKNELYGVSLIVVVVVAVGLFLISGRPELEIVRAEQNILLDKEDFYVFNDEKIVKVGEASWENIQMLLPGGKMLGMSTIYQSKEGDCYYTFSEKENMLVIMHIESMNYATARGIKVGDSVAQISEKYGSICDRVIMAKRPQDFDLVYGGEDNIVFQIRDNIVKRIVLEKELGA